MAPLPSARRARVSARRRMVAAPSCSAPSNCGLDPVSWTPGEWCAPRFRGVGDYGPVPDRASWGPCGGRFADHGPGSRRVPLVEDFRFVRDRAAVAETRMPALPVVPGLDVGEDRLTGGVAGAPVGLEDQLYLQRGEEALGDGVVPAVAFLAHARDEPVRRQERLVGAAGVLAAAIGVMQQPRTRPAIRERHPERRQREVLLQRLAP